MGALRIARTVTGRDTMVMFTGAYHGIFDEVIVRGTASCGRCRRRRASCATRRRTCWCSTTARPNRCRSSASARIELAAVLVEPVQSRRRDFQPVEFLRELRAITAQSGTLLIFDEVVTGFRAHPGGAQALFGIKADLATYGKVVGGGFPIGVIAGKREFMDALDGGAWQYGDDSMPTVGRHLLRRHLRASSAGAGRGPRRAGAHQGQRAPRCRSGSTQRTAELAAELNAFCNDVGAPIAHQAVRLGVEDPVPRGSSAAGPAVRDDAQPRHAHPRQLPVLLHHRAQRGGFRQIIQAYKDSVIELQEADFLPRRTATTRTVMDAREPPVAGARIGRDPDGQPAWFVPNPEQPGKFVKVG